ncbi:MAG: VOC family protein [Anaerolineae bacterium]|nr:VOC family protein [Anaerolineae bacterium]
MDPGCAVLIWPASQNGRHLAAAQAHLADHGVAVVLGPRGRGDGVTQMYCYDPDGHLIELHTLL